MADIENETNEKNEKRTYLQKVYNKGCDIIETTVEIGASYHLGQNAIKQIDRLLWTLEKSALWSVPTPTNPPKQQESNGTFGKPAPLVRPLPWLLFLPLLVVMRMIRATLNMGAVFVGADSVKPTTVVKFIQVRRRRLRIIKYRGLRKMAIKKTKTEVSNDEAVTWRQRIYNTLRGAMCVYPKHNESTEKIVHAVNSNEVPADAPVKNEQKRKHDDLDSDNEDEDPEYMPSCSESDDSSDSDDERDEDEPVCDAKPLLKRPSSKTSLSAEVIKEENENVDSDSSTASAESDETQKRKEPQTPNQTVPATPKANGTGNDDHQLNNKMQMNQLDGITSDEFFSPEDSECPSPEIPMKMNMTKNDLSEPHYDHKISSQNLIASEQVQKSMNGSNIAMANKGRADGNQTGNNRGHGKRKNKKKISNPFNRRRK